MGRPPKPLDCAQLRDALAAHPGATVAELSTWLGENEKRIRKRIQACEQEIGMQVCRSARGARHFLDDADAEARDNALLKEYPEELQRLFVDIGKYPGQTHQELRDEFCNKERGMCWPESTLNDRLRQLKRDGWITKAQRRYILSRGGAFGAPVHDRHEGWYLTTAQGRDKPLHAVVSQPDVDAYTAEWFASMLEETLMSEEE